MFRNTFTSLAWVCVFALVGVGSLHSCGILSPDPPTTAEAKGTLAALEAEASDVAMQLAAARASGDPAQLAAAEAADEDLTRRWADFEARAIRDKINPLGQFIGTINPALGALAIFGTNAAAALATKRGRKHAWNAVRNFSPGSTATGDPFKPVEGVRDLGRMMGWLHSNEASKAAADAPTPTPKATKPA